MERRSKTTVSAQVIQLAGVIPYRLVNRHVQFCLITGRRSGRWQFPKGHVKLSESLRETAAAEALEEAGIRGPMAPSPLTTISYQKNGAPYSLTMWLMEVQSIRLKWKESKERFRIWASVPDAFELLDSQFLKELSLEALARIEITAAPTASIDRTPMPYWNPIHSDRISG